MNRQHRFFCKSRGNPGFFWEGGNEHIFKNGLVVTTTPSSITEICASTDNCILTMCVQLGRRGGTEEEGTGAEVEATTFEAVMVGGGERVGDVQPKNASG